MLRKIDMSKGLDIQVLDSFFRREDTELRKITTAVEAVLQDIQNRGDAALCEYTRRFDSVDILPEKLRVGPEEIEAAYTQIDPMLLEVMRKSKQNILAFHEKQKESSWFMTQENGVILGQRLTPIDTVGVYVPGGTAPLPSSVLMNVIPAKVAGVRRIVMATPPQRDGSVHSAILAAACEAGVDEIYRMGGAQAIAAMAYGTETVPRVHKITGPGNMYVATAKRLVYGACDIDMVAGPSEIAIIADTSANPVFVAADMLSQAEHDTMASAVLFTPSAALAQEVAEELEKQMKKLGRNEIIRRSLENHGAAVITATLAEAVQAANRMAPEHLEVCVADPFSLLGDIRDAGAVFLGHFSPEPLGDYFAGPNHVLPTGGTARFFSPLGVGDFMKKSSVIHYTRQALEAVQKDVRYFAQAEGLTAHANAIAVRFDQAGTERGE